MSLATDIADAVAAEINTAASGGTGGPSTFSQSFTAQRRVLPVHELKDLIDLKVTVVPKAVEISGSTRSVSQLDISVDIGVQKKLASTDIDTEVATLGTLVDEIADYLRRHPLTQLLGVAWVSTVNEPVYAPEHLAEQRVFTSVLTVTYRAMK